MQLCSGRLLLLAAAFRPANRNRGEGWQDKKAEGPHDHSRSAVWGSGVVCYLTE